MKDLFNIIKDESTHGTAPYVPINIFTENMLDIRYNNSDDLALVYFLEHDIVLGGWTMDSPKWRTLKQLHRKQIELFYNLCWKTKVGAVLDHLRTQVSPNARYSTSPGISRAFGALNNRIDGGNLSALQIMCKTQLAVDHPHIYEQVANSANVISVPAIFALLDVVKRTLTDIETLEKNNSMLRRNILTAIWCVSTIMWHSRAYCAHADIVGHGGPSEYPQHGRPETMDTNGVKSKDTTLILERFRRYMGVSDDALVCVWDDQTPLPERGNSTISNGIVMLDAFVELCKRCDTNARQTMENPITNMI